MRLNIFAGCLLAALLAVPAAAQHHPTPPGSKPSDAHTIHGDAHYVAMMIVHHDMGVEMAQIATDKAQRAEVRQLATKIVTVQQAEKKELEGFKSSLKPDAAATTHDSAAMHDMPGMKKGQQDIERLKKASGAEVDRLFLASMTEHHQGAVRMSRQAKPALKDANVRQFADKTITNQTKEIAEIKRLQAGASK